MKKVYYLLSMLLVLSFAANELAAQTIGQQTLTKKEIRKARRQAHEKFMEQQNQLAFEQAVQALKEQSFVVEVDQLIYPRGSVQYVSPITNFVYINKGDAVVQIAVNNFAPGPNGVGGVTVEGTPSDIKMTTDKKGFVYYNFTAQGIAISATVNIQLTPGDDRATVTIYPNFNSRILTMTGKIVPYNDSDIFQGSTI
ncbi:MAG: DUF4251 domain-containing protein [Bacteroidales bacterium]|nr:DUF4251 domain-containing protein [Bacteroidales bacterium]